MKRRNERHAEMLVRCANCDQLWYRDVPGVPPRRERCTGCGEPALAFETRRKADIAAFLDAVPVRHRIVKARACREHSRSSLSDDLGEHKSRAIDWADRCAFCAVAIRAALLRRSPGECVLCGCTEERACMTRVGPCGWADRRRTICTACVGTPMSHETVTTASMSASSHGDVRAMVRRVIRADDEQLRDVLLLVSVKVPMRVIRAWSPVQRAAAETWAAREHLGASDNPVRRLPPPACVRTYLPRAGR